MSALLSPPASLAVEPTIQSLLLSHFTSALIAAAHLLIPGSPTFSELLHALPLYTDFYKVVALSGTTQRATADSTIKRAYIATNSALTTQAIDPSIVLSNRFHTLRWLLYVSDLNADMFWEQTLRFTASTVKAQLSSENDELSTSLHHTLDILLKIVQDVENLAPHIMVGSKWISVCEYWISVGKRVRSAVIKLFNRN